MIKADELDLTPSEPKFLELAIAELGNAATATDGFPELHTAATQATADAKAHLDAFDRELVETAGVQTLIDPHSLDEDAIAFGASLPGGAQVVTDFAALVEPAPVMPPSCGGQKQALTLDKCFLNFGKVRVNEHSPTLVVVAKNSSDKAVTIKSMTLSGVSGGPADDKADGTIAIE